MYDKKNYLEDLWRGLKNPRLFNKENEELLYQLKRKPLCFIGIHRYEWDTVWYYELTCSCKICGRDAVGRYRDRYPDWASTHTLHPFGWPWLVYTNIRYIFWDWVANRAQNKD